MAEDLHVLDTASKKEQYEFILPQMNALVENEPDLIANMANIAAVLKQAFGFFWVGFYIVRGEKLVLGPFQGSVACTRIAYGRGVCGTAWEQAKTIIVPDVEKFTGHIACSSLSKSEIVVPVFRNNNVIAVLDVDSDELNDFDEIDEIYLNKIVELLMLD